MGAGAIRSCTRFARARPRVRLARVFVTLWLALLVSLLAYAAVRGASVLSDLDEARLIAEF
ncbi:MAG TPA: hypothetical protein VMU79_02180 [Casimicrobiaceae bacterium]|jgi:hypothetical protein|nr:hypothetical protein [Casimicrobiaceae bacterium]